MRVGRVRNSDLAINASGEIGGTAPDAFPKVAIVPGRKQVESGVEGRGADTVSATSIAFVPTAASTPSTRSTSL